MKEIIITSSVLILCILLIRKIFRGKISGRLQYALWLLAALRLMLPVAAVPVAVGSLESFRVVDLTQALEMQTGDLETLLEKPVPFTAPLPGVIGKPEGKTLSTVSMPDEAAAEATSVFDAGKTGLTWLTVLRGLWRGGMVVTALWIIGVNLLFARRLHRNRTEYVQDTSAEQANAGICRIEAHRRSTAHLNEKRTAGRTKLYIVDGLKSPCLYGLPFREAVYFPPDIAADETRLRHVLVHEMCHKRHGDGFWSLLRSLLVIVYWFNPLVWAAALLSKQDCELACDEAAIRALGETERIPYGETLLSILTRRSSMSDVVCTATTMTGNGRNIKERIRLIAERPRALGAAAVLTAVAAAAAAVIVFTKDPSFHGATWSGETFVKMPVAAGSIQIALPETVEGICGYAADKGGDLVLYQVSSQKEVGRFCELSYGEAVVLWEQGKEIVPAGDYGQNRYLKEYIDRQTNGGTEVTHHSGADAAEKSMAQDYLPAENTEGNAGPVYLPDEKITTTYTVAEDSSETTYIIVDDNDKTGNAAEGSAAQDYQPTENAEGNAGPVYLPDEKITTTYTPAATGNCYVYVKGSYAGVAEQYLNEMEFINSELEAAAERAAASMR